MTGFAVFPGQNQIILTGFAYKIIFLNKNHPKSIKQSIKIDIFILNAAAVMPWQ